LDPNGFLGEVDPTVHNDFIRIWNYPVPFQVIFPDLDDPMPIIEFLARVRGIVVHHIGLSIIVNEKGGIYSIEVQFYGIAPTLPRVFGLNDNVSKSTTNMGGDHIEGVVMGIVGDPRSVYTLADPDLLHLQLGASLQDMADLGPVHQIPGMKDRYPGVDGKGRGHHLIIVALLGDGRIVIVTQYGGVVNHSYFHGSVLIIIID